MQLKKINTALQQALVALGLTEANELQQETFSTIKSGVDAVIQSPEGSGKSTTIALNVIQRLDKPFQLSPRALIICLDKAKVLEMVEIFDSLNKFNQLRVYYVHDKTNLDEDKNQISLGIDVLIGTPNQLTAMFGSAGFDVNQLKLFILDDADLIFKNRYEPKILRLSESIEKVQRLFFCSQITERTEMIAENIMIEPLFFEMDEDEETYFEEE
ncbi:DEAD/DEAH box helicase [Flavobacterium stagni]|uniref:DEAD/DEAH box helicase n=1 Tax=Flavobacterium stagni TaxID=2506421 RepID=A0A4Q1K6V2_9FLAO|nr:DEAD/DEAH box helicase [Flavobacterium stagni]RXR20289.1 DEAD/DEAH box helicase [Flavobacterium stagni]